MRQSAKVLSRTESFPGGTRIIQSYSRPVTMVNGSILTQRHGRVVVWSGPPAKIIQFVNRCRVRLAHFIWPLSRGL
jgi:hypothetical protein